MFVFLRARLTMRRLFPLTWAVTTPHFRVVRARAAREGVVRNLLLLTLSQATMPVDLVTLPLRLPFLLARPRFLPRRNTGGPAPAPRETPPR